MRCQSPEMSDGSWPISSERRPQAVLCDGGASMTDLITVGFESTSPMPVMPASVLTRTIRASWLPSAIVVSTAPGWRSNSASTSVMIIGLSCFRARASSRTRTAPRMTDCTPAAGRRRRRTARPCARSAVRRPGSSARAFRATHGSSRSTRPDSYRTVKLLGGNAVIAPGGVTAHVAIADVGSDEIRVALSGRTITAAAGRPVVELVAAVEHHIGELGGRCDAEGLVEPQERALPRAPDEYLRAHAVHPAGQAVRPDLAPVEQGTEGDLVGRHPERAVCRQAAAVPAGPA